VIIVFILFVLIAYASLSNYGKHSSNSGSPIIVSRSTPKTCPSDRVECGNCRGTGLDGFGIMPDSFTCEACDGRGSYKIDPNAKYMTLSELMEKYKK
jgi:DnaJ-class molecular chaperone